MFEKLTFEEMAKLYGALGELEKHYGKEVVNEAIREMAEKLDKQAAEKETKEQLEVEVKEEKQEQLELFKPKKQGRSRHTGAYKKAVAIANIHGMTLDEFLTQSYYIEGLLQREIAEILEVDQKTVSRWINAIPKKTFKKVIGR